MIEILDASFGEIDIIAKDKYELVFIEVKTRSQNEFGTPAEAVDKNKKKHIYHAAEYYLLIRRLEKVFCRIDVIEIYISGKNAKINHLKNCIMEKPYRNFKLEEGDEIL